MADDEDLALSIKLRSIRTIHLTAGFDSDEEEEDEDSKDLEDGATSSRVTVFADPGKLGFGWKIRFRRDELSLMITLISTYDVVDGLDLRQERLRGPLEQFVRDRARRDVHPYLMSVASSAEGIFARTAIKPPRGDVVIESIEGLFGGDDPS